MLLGIVGVVFAHKYFFRAFPEASVDFKVSRAEALARAQKFVGGLGEDVSGYQSAIVFDVDDNAKTYLEREVGLQQANQLMSSELNIWYWDVRFFRPQQEEEFYVRVSPAGEIVGYEHKIEEARAGASLDRAAAETAAQEFLRGKMGVDLSQVGFSPRRSQLEQKTKPLGLVVHLGEARISRQGCAVPAAGDAAGRPRGELEEFLQVPEAWERELREAAFGKYSLQPAGHHSLPAADGSGALAGNSADECAGRRAGAARSSWGSWWRFC